MTTTELYSGYTAEGKPSSRVLQPPGGGSSNIFGGSDPAPKAQVRQEMTQQSPAAAQNQSPSNPTADAKQEYQKNKPKGRAEAPFAMFAESGKTSAPSQFDQCAESSQTTGTFNPITHEESEGKSPCKAHDDRRVHPQQVVREQEQQPARMVRGQGNYNKGKVQYNPITGEEYPADYGQQKTEEEEEQGKDETEESEKDKESENTPTDDNNSSTQKTEASPAPIVQTPPAPIQKVRQPPGGVSSGLW